MEEKYYTYKRIRKILSDWGAYADSDFALSTSTSPETEWFVQLLRRRGYPSYAGFEGYVEIKVDVERALADLDYLHRNILVDCLIEGGDEVNYRPIAASYGITVGDVAQLRDEGIRQMVKFLEG